MHHVGFASHLLNDLLYLFKNYIWNIRLWYCPGYIAARNTAWSWNRGHSNDSICAICNYPTIIAGSATAPTVDAYRIRNSDYRVICEIQHGRLLVTVITIGSRRDAYD